MKTGTSLYLDVVRFSAAVMVFLEHLREHTHRSFGPFWNHHPFWKHYLHPASLTAVIVFFVLSGYVIAHVLETREKSPLEFAASRFARLYSVVLPTLLLVLVSTSLEALKFPHAFDSLGSRSDVLVDYLATGLFTSQFWIWSHMELPNAPFWTLSFEASYYVGIALLVFARGPIRILSVIALVSLAGPTMLLLAPTWLLGYLTYYISQRRKIGPVTASIIWMSSSVLLVLCPLIQDHFRQQLAFVNMPDNTVGAILASYAAAACFAANVITLNALSEHFERLFSPLSAQIRWLGSTTFALYLFHQSLLSLITVYAVQIPPTPFKLLLLVGGTFLVVATLGRLCESSKGAYRNFFYWVCHHFIPRPVVAER